MNRSGVDKAIVWPHPPHRHDIVAANSYISKAAKRHPDRLLPFGWADPAPGSGPRDRLRVPLLRYEWMHVELARCKALLEGEISSEERAFVLGGSVQRLLNRDRSKNGEEI